MQFTAGFVYAEDDGETSMLGFADHQFDTRESVLLIRTLQPTDDSDPFYIEVNDQGSSSHGGILRLVASPCQLLIYITAEAEQQLGIGAAISIDITDQRWPALYPQLQRFCEASSLTLELRDEQP